MTQIVVLCYTLTRMSATDFSAYSYKTFHSVTLLFLYSTNAENTDLLIIMMTPEQRQKRQSVKQDFASEWQKAIYILHLGVTIESVILLSLIHISMKTAVAV